LKEKSTKGVIFDLDGTLIDSYQAIYLSFQHTYINMGLQPLPLDEVKRAVGYGLSITFRELLGEERVPEALRLFRQKYEEVYRQNTYLLPGARKVLEALQERRIKLAIASNKLGRFSREIFQHFGMDQLFAIILGDEDVLQNKPHPEMLFYAIERMGLRNEEVVFIGDSLIDIQTGKNAGVRVFAIPTGVTTREELEKARPALILNNLLDLLNQV
jgi:2-phosphoglycolate phosphatase